MAYFGVTPYRKVGGPGTDFQTFHSQIKVTLNVTFFKVQVRTWQIPRQFC